MESAEQPDKLFMRVSAAVSRQYESAGYVPARFALCVGDHGGKFDESLRCRPTDEGRDIHRWQERRLFRTDRVEAWHIGQRACGTKMRGLKKNHRAAGRTC